MASAEGSRCEARVYLYSEYHAVGASVAFAGRTLHIRSVQ